MKANHYPGGNVTIVLPAGIYDLSILRTGGDDETTGDLNITADLKLNGAGAATTIVDAHQLDRVVSVGTGISVSISKLTLRNGLVGNIGGGLLNNGILTLANDVISGNQTTGGSAGGGIVNLAPGVLVLNDTIVSGNQAVGNAGGVYNDSNSSLTLINTTIRDNQTTNGGYGGGLLNAGTLTLKNSLVSHNQSTGKGGGIANFTGVLTGTNSTISNNNALSDGGAIYNLATVNMYFATIVGNLADSEATGAGLGGGIYNIGTVNLKASLLAQNFAAAVASDGFGTYNSLDYNLIQTAANMTLTGVTGHNLLGSDPLIDSTRMNGGLTLTRALLTGSPALDVIPIAQCTDSFGAPLVIDQRGFPRPVNGACDIGAFEGQQPMIAYLRNLVRNGDAEASAGSPNGAFVGVPDWQTSGQLMTTIPYNAPGGFPSVLTDTVPTNHGDNFFAGGNSIGAGGTQVIDLSQLAAGIDAGGTSYDFYADLGGYLTQGDSATVEADFLDGTGHLLTQAILGPVTAADRGNLTGLLHRDTTGPVPVNTRMVELFVNMNATNGPFNDGYIDNISLVIQPETTVFLPFVIK